MKKILFFAFLCLSLTVYAGKEKPKVLFDFEDDKEFTRFERDNDATKDYPTEKIVENATSGKYSLKVSFPKEGQWPGLHFTKFDKDWSKYDLFKVDIFNPQKEVIAVNFAAADEDAGFTKELYFGEYSKRYSARSILRPGKNTLEVELAGATIEDKTRAVLTNKMKRFSIFLMARPDPCVLFLDNIRLEKSEE